MADQKGWVILRQHGMKNHVFLLFSQATIRITLKDHFDHLRLIRDIFETIQSLKIVFELKVFKTSASKW